MAGYKWRQSIIWPCARARGIRHCCHDPCHHLFVTIHTATFRIQVSCWQGMILIIIFVLLHIHIYVLLHIIISVLLYIPPLFACKWVALVASIWAGIAYECYLCLMSEIQRVNELLFMIFLSRTCLWMFLCFDEQNIARKWVAFLARALELIFLMHVLVCLFFLYMFLFICFSYTCSCLFVFLMHVLVCLFFLCMFLFVCYAKCRA